MSSVPCLLCPVPYVLCPVSCPVSCVLCVLSCPVSWPHTLAEDLGASFRHQMYPDPSGGGVLRLHSTFRHDLKIKVSEGGILLY